MQESIDEDIDHLEIGSRSFCDRTASFSIDVDPQMMMKLSIPFHDIIVRLCDMDMFVILFYLFSK